MSILEIQDLEELPEPAWEPGSVTAGRNALGFAPQRVLFLWPFARPMNLRAQVIGHGWPQIGPVQILLRPGLKLLRRCLGSMDEVYAELSQLSEEPGRQKAPQLRIGDGHWGSYYGYPVHPLTVDGSIWQDVISALIGKCDLFVADMTAKRRPTGIRCQRIPNIWIIGRYLLHLVRLRPGGAAGSLG